MSDLGIFEVFPRDIVLHILERFDMKSLCSFSECCKRAREMMLIMLPRTAWVDELMVWFYEQKCRLFFELYPRWRNPGFDYNYILTEAAEHGHIDVIELILRDGRVDPSSSENCAVWWACASGHLEIVKILLNDPRVDPSDDDNGAIVEASEHGHTDIVRMLLKDKRVDPSDFENTAIITASQNGHLEVVRILLNDPRVDPSADNDCAIMLAAEQGHWEIVQLLRERGCKINGPVAPLSSDDED